MHCVSSALFNIKFERKREFYIANNSRASARGLLDTSTKVENFIAYKLSRVLRNKIQFANKIHFPTGSPPLWHLANCQRSQVTWRATCRYHYHVTRGRRPRDAKLTRKRLSHVNHVTVTCAAYNMSRVAWCALHSSAVLEACQRAAAGCSSEQCRVCTIPAGL